MPLSIGAQVGPYEIVAAIGAGGMGEVYKARDTRLGRTVALKVLPAAREADPERRRRFEHEARAIAALNHPHICVLHDVGTAAPAAGAGAIDFLVMEFVDGETLAARLRRGPLSSDDVLRYGAQMADALSAAHHAGVVHRDLKPANVMLTRAGVKLLDFGLAKLRPAPVGPRDASTTMAAGRDPVTAEGLVLGTVPYMAPEQVEGRDADARADIFALGAVLYEMATGRRAFEGSSAASVMAAVLEREPPPMTSLAPLTPPALERVVRKCLAKDPDARWQAAADLADELRWLSTDAQAPVSRPGPVPRRRRWVIGAVAGAALAVATAVAVVLWPWLERGSPDEVTPYSAPRVTPFLASPAIERQPAWSPLGNLIAYVSDAGGNDDVWICDPSGSNPINLTPDSPGADAYPAWSPDGQRLAFYSEREDGGIFTMTALGGSVRKIVPVKPSVLYTFSLQWAQDSSLVFTNFDAAGRKQVYRLAATGGEARCLTCGNVGTGSSQAGRLSASGRLLAFTSAQVGPRATLFVLDLTTGLVQTLAGLSGAPVWLDEDRSLMFLSSREGTPDLWQMRVDPATGTPLSDAVRLTSGLGAAQFSASGDGRLVLVVQVRSVSSLWRFPAGRTPGTDLGGGTRVPTGSFRDSRGRWTPDGREIVFESNRRGGMNVWKVSARGGEPVRMTSGVGYEYRPRVSPDGRWVALDASYRDGNHVHLMRADGGDMRVIDPTWPDRYSATCCSSWSSDGTRLAITPSARSAADAASEALLLLGLDGQSGAVLVNTRLDVRGGSPSYPRWSPDGEFLVYEALWEGSWDLWIADPKQGGSSRLTDLPGNERVGAWRRAPREVYFTKDERSIWRVAVDPAGRPAGVPETWLDLKSPLFPSVDSIDFSPSGDEVLVSIGERASDLWLVEHTAPAPTRAPR